MEKKKSMEKHGGSWVLNIKKNIGKSVSPKVMVDPLKIFDMLCKIHPRIGDKYKSIVWLNFRHQEERNTRKRLLFSSVLKHCSCIVYEKPHSKTFFWLKKNVGLVNSEIVVLLAQFWIKPKISFNKWFPTVKDWLRRFWNSKQTVRISAPIEQCCFISVTLPFQDTKLLCATKYKMKIYNSKREIYLCWLWKFNT